MKGFTLVELVITIAIVIILSVVSVPIYRGYINKAKWAEGYALLGVILSAQKTYFSEYGNFLAWDNSSSGNGGNKALTAYETVLAIDARGNKYFTCFHDSCHSQTKTSEFKAGVAIPNELINNSKSFLMLIYNITTGATFIETEDYW